MIKKKERDRCSFFATMSIVTNEEIAKLQKASATANFKLVNALVRYRLQEQQEPEADAEPEPVVQEVSKKKDNKRPAPTPAAEPVPAESAPKKAKEKKEKPDGWLCEGNLAAGTACPLDPENQSYVGQTRHEKKNRNLCKVCKSAYQKAMKGKDE